MSLMDSEGTRPDRRPPESTVPTKQMFLQFVLCVVATPHPLETGRFGLRQKYKSFSKCRHTESLLAGTAAFGLDLSCCTYVSNSVNCTEFR